ncbi:auxin response factor 6-like protein isoform X1, partial [Tanacetum coccineum]
MPSFVLSSDSMHIGILVVAAHAAMLFEIEESSVQRYMGTITGIGDLDPVRLPNSHWRSVK